MSNEIGLAAVIQQLRREMVEAMRAGEGEGIRFQLQELEVELQVAVTKGAEGKGGVGIKVLEISAGGKAEKSRTHRVTLKLKAEGGTPAGPVFLGG